MLVVIFALVAVAITATIVIRDAHQPAHRAPSRHTGHRAEDPLATVDAPTEGVDLSELDLGLVPQAGPPGITPLGTPHLQPDDTRLIQTEVVLEDTGREHTIALTRLVVGITACGVFVGLGVIALVRGIDLLVHALSG
jgi:hypothetical protein